MRTRNTILTLAVALLTSPLFGQEPESEPEEIPPAQSEPGMRGELEAVYNSWRKIMAKGDYNAWQAITASSRQVEVRNEIVSRRLKFPEALFQAPIQAPDISDLILLDVLTRPETAAAIYFGKANFGLTPPNEVRENIIVLRYQKENGKWLFDTMRVVKVESEVLGLIRGKDFSFLKDDTFQPLPKLPELPQPVPKPDYVAAIQVTSAGFESDITVNGRHVATVTNGTGGDLLIGGLRRGNNKIVVKTKPAENTTGAPDRIEVAIYGAKTMTEEKTNRVFHWLPMSDEERKAGLDQTFGVAQ
ncbi:MAG: hypothetical protein HKN23_03385 [Verrucomicrobiales bacterium]|nr:hypothetical protein [Verrucomicrobiales bacterium]